MRLSNRFIDYHFLLKISKKILLFFFLFQKNLSFIQINRMLFFFWMKNSDSDVKNQIWSLRVEVWRVKHSTPKPQPNGTDGRIEEREKKKFPLPPFFFTEMLTHFSLSLSLSLCQSQFFLGKNSKTAFRRVTLSLAPSSINIDHWLGVLIEKKKTEKRLVQIYFNLLIQMIFYKLKESLKYPFYHIDHINFKKKIRFSFF